MHDRLGGRISPRSGEVPICYYPCPWGWHAIKESIPHWAAAHYTLLKSTSGTVKPSEQCSLNEGVQRSRQHNDDLRSNASFLGKPRAAESTRSGQGASAAYCALCAFATSLEPLIGAGVSACAERSVGAPAGVSAYLSQGVDAAESSVSKIFRVNGSSDSVICSLLIFGYDMRARGYMLVAQGAWQ